MTYIESKKFTRRQVQWTGMLLWSTFAVFLWIIVPIVVSATYYTIFNSSAEWPESFAALGDTFGSASSLFSALAMAGVIYSLQLQQSEQTLTRLEMAKAREEAAKAAKAQLEIAKTERENLEEKRRIAVGQAETNTRLLEVLERQSEALSHQIDKMSQQLSFQSKVYFREMFDTRFARLEKLRNTEEFNGMSLSSYLDTFVSISADEKEFVINNGAESKEISKGTPYSVLSNNYVRLLRAVLSMSQHPTFKDLDVDERRWYGRQVAEALSTKEKLVLLCAFSGDSFDITASDNNSSEKNRSRSLQEDLAEMDALAFISKIAKKCLKDEWQRYRALVPKDH